jgi:hypothetical protein
METDTEVPGRASPAGANSGSSPGPGAGERLPRQSASYLHTLGGLIDDVIGAEAALARAAAARTVAVDAARVFAESGDSGGSVFGKDMAKRSLVAEIACGLRLPLRTAETLLAISGILVHDRPDTLTALAAGRLSYRHAVILAQETLLLPDTDAARLEREMLVVAGELTVSEFDRKVRKRRERLNPESITARQVKSIADRQIQFTPARDGMAWLSAYLTAADAAAAYHRLTGLGIALQGPHEPRTLTQLRADVFSDLILDPAGAAGMAAPGSGARFRGIKPDLIVTVPMLTLLGMSEEPADLDGYGPIDPDTARALASKCPTAVRILTHPETGAVLSVGRDRYRIPQSLRTMLQVRDGTCRFPGSNRSAAHSDIDHTVDWAYNITGKGTDHNNLEHLSPAAHALKHGAGWTTSQTPDGTGIITWTTPTGHHYTTRPETIIGSAVNAELRKQAAAAAAATATVATTAAAKRATTAKQPAPDPLPEDPPF